VTAEAKFGIRIEGINASKAAYDETLRSNRDLIASVERLAAVSKEQAADTRFMRDAMVAAAAEAKRLREEEARLAEEQKKASRRLEESGRGIGRSRQVARRREPSHRRRSDHYRRGRAAFVVGAKGAADYQEKIDQVADATGFTTAQIAGLEIAASDMGRSFDQIRPSLDFFVRKIGEAADGNTQALQTFNDLGVAVRDASGRSLPPGTSSERFKPQWARSNRLPSVPALRWSSSGAPGLKRSRPFSRHSIRSRRRRATWGSRPRRPARRPRGQRIPDLIDSGRQSTRSSTPSR